MAIKKFKPESPDKAIGKIKGDAEFARLAHLNRLVDDVNNLPAPTIEPVIDSFGNLIAADSSNDTVTVGNGAAHFIPSFSGLLLVNDHYNGSVELWLCGGGNTTVLVSRTNYGPGAGTLTIDGAHGGYKWTNTHNQVGPHTFTVIKTRSGA